MSSALLWESLRRKLFTECLVEFICKGIQHWDAFSQGLLGTPDS